MYELVHVPVCTCRETHIFPQKMTNMTRRERERGTPHSLLKLYIILPLLISIATAIGIGLTYSLWKQYFVDYDYVPSIVVVANVIGSGVIATLMGLLYGSMSVFSLTSGIALGIATFEIFLMRIGKDLSLALVCEMLKAAVAIAFPSVFAACILPILRKSRILSSFQISKDDLISRGVFLSCQVAVQTMVGGSKDGFTSDNILLLALVTSFGFFTIADVTTVGLVFAGSLFMVVRSVTNFSLYGGEPFVLIIASLVVMSILVAFFRNRQHPNGSISLADSMTGIEIASSRAAVIGMIHTLLNVSDKDVELFAFFGVMVGAFTMLGLAILFGAVGDCWEPVGSNQWQMTSVDTLGLLFHFVLPIVLLLYRACDKYNVLSAFQASFNFEFGSYLSMILNVSVLFTVVIGIGMPVLNSLSPISPYLFARSYLHGQPNTKKVALVIAFTDIFEETKNNPQRLKELLVFTKENKVVLNVFVNFSNVKLYADILKELIRNGHHIGISTYSYHFESASVTFDKVLTVREEVLKVLGAKPSWYLPTSGHRHPFALKACADNYMRVCYWSTLCHTGIMNAEKCLIDIKRDVVAKGGGNIIYFTKGATNNQTWTSILSLVQETIKYLNEINFEARDLNEVVKDDQTLQLRHRERIS